MNAIVEAARKLETANARLGEYPSARGADAVDIPRIKEAFVDLGFPLPSGLLDVYKVTMGIPGYLNDAPLLAAPFDFMEDTVLCRIGILEDLHDFTDLREVIIIGYGNRGELIIDRDGQCGVDLIIPDTGPVRELANPSDFETAFRIFAERHIRELEEAAADDRGD